MNSLPIIGYELKRIILSRKYFYLLLILSLTAYSALTSLLIHGLVGTAPYSRLSYANFLSRMSPALLATLVLLCAAVYTERELSVRKILFSAPISPAWYYAIKGTAITVAFLLIATLVVAYSFAFYLWQFRFTQFGTFIEPILIFLVPSVVFVFGLSMAAGRFSVKLLYGLVPTVLFLGMFNFRLPVWMDLCGNNFLVSHFKMLVMNQGHVEIVYCLPISFLLSRCLLVVCGVVLLAMSCRKLRSV